MYSPATLVLEDFSVDVAGSVRDEQIFVKWMGTMERYCSFRFEIKIIGEKV